MHGQQATKTENNGGVVIMMEKLFAEVMNVKGIVSTIQEDNIAWKNKIEKEVNEVKDSVELAYNLIVDKTKQCKEGEKQLKEELNDKMKEILNVVQKTRTQSEELKNVKMGISQTQCEIKELQDQHAAMKIPVMEIKTQIEMVTGSIEYPVNRTVVAQRVWCEENEDIEKVARTIINKALNLPDVCIVRAIRKSGKPNGTGLIKIELQTEADVETVLWAKKILLSFGKYFSEPQRRKKH